MPGICNALVRGPGIGLWMQGREQHDLESVPVYPTALVSGRHVGQSVGGFQPEALPGKARPFRPYDRAAIRRAF